MKQLGIQNYDNISQPTPLNFEKKIEKIVACAYHTILMTEEGEIYGFGDNGYGQIALKSEIKNVKEPQIIMKNPNISIIVSKSAFNCDWSIETHSHFSFKFQIKILFFLNSLKYFQNKTKIKIPKFVVHEIIKFIASPSFLLD